VAFDNITGDVSHENGFPHATPSNINTPDRTSNIFRINIFVFISSKKTMVLLSFSTHYELHPIFFTKFLQNANILFL